MKYCLFEGGDIVGPFSVEELMKRKGFDAHSLVCPQEHSEEESYWKAAQEYADFAGKETSAAEPLPETPSLEPISEQAEQLVEELNKTLHDLDALEGLEPEELTTPVDQFTETSPAVQPSQEQPSSAANEQAAIPATTVVTQTVNQASPIEEYFNTMRTGDLGNILGMPDPKASSDMNLARVLEKQFEKTDPATGGHPMAEGEDPFDEFTPKEKEALPATPDEADRATQATLTQEAAQTALPKPEEKKEEKPKETPDEKVSAVPVASAVVEEIKPAEKNVPAPAVVSAISQPKVVTPADMQKTPVEQEPDWMRTAAKRPKWLVVGIVGISIIVLLAILSAWGLRKKTQNAPTAPVAVKTQGVSSPTPVVFKSAEKPVAKTAVAKTELAVAPVSVKAATQAAPANAVTQALPVQNKEELAKQIVQQYVLDSKRGTIETFLQKKYASQLASGYAAVWSAEPLHKQAYVVKYRLAKTRQEPIVYIFQVDTAKKKLTGALNNITLDLVGKIK